MLEVLIGSGIAFLAALCGWLLSHYWQARSYRLAVASDRAQWNAGVEEWAGRVIDTMVRMHTHFDRLNHPEAIAQSSELAISLSILVDQGRLYFPNVMRDRYGEEKQESRQGYRSAVLDPLVAAVWIARGTEPEFDVPDPKGKYGTNRNARALRLYLNAFLSLIERVLLVRSSHQNLIARLEEIGDLEGSRRLRSFLCPENEGGPVPPGHRYWLGQESGPQIPSERAIFEGR
ncbi:hypothetical protein VRRI112168_07665 [Vreelandella rituensis]|uniref:DUF4760 domain-containing protein n=1 Tax=Vreelandella rituensis TaxID=2282306 RepID=A0A368TU30_9GAMM|nr:hypothetical protein [Halomonas rituensis]RCV88138.1 hypothetical protein DU506_15400 [Halomonas rituensis]